MLKKYKSKFYKYPIEVESITWEILVKIFTKNQKEVIYSWYDLEEKTSYSPYIKNAVLASFIWKIPEDILILGFWAWSYAKYFKDYLWEKVNISWVEIDESMIEIAKNEFKLNNINYFNLDIKEALNILSKKKTNKFEVIFIDIYDENSLVPKFFLENKFIQSITSLLNTNWKIIFNYANYNENKNFYEKIDKLFLENLKNKEKIHILNWKDDYWNLIAVYNLKEKFDSEKIILEYLQKVQAWDINYDSNLISKIHLK